MTLTWSQFVTEAKELESVLPDWHWRTFLFNEEDTLRPGFGFLCHRFSKHFNYIPLEPTAPEPHSELQMEESLVMDSCTVPFAPKNCTTTVECHVVFSTSYQVPVLYFNEYTETGSAISPHGTQFSNSTITQASHPVLDMPFYQVHPCKTAKLMAEILELQHKEVSLAHWGGRYLVTWLSWCGQTIGLKLDSTAIFLPSKQNPQLNP